MPEVERKMKLWRDEVREGNLKEINGREQKGGKRERAVQMCEVAECKGNLFATTAMTGVGGRSIS